MLFIGQPLNKICGIPELWVRLAMTPSAAREVLSRFTMINLVGCRNRCVYHRGHRALSSWQGCRNTSSLSFEVKARNTCPPRLDGTILFRRQRNIHSFIGGTVVVREGRDRGPSFTAGVVRRSSQGQADAMADSRSFEEDCMVVEQCTQMINSKLDIPMLEARLTELDKEVADPELYEDSNRVAKVVKERAMVEAKLSGAGCLASELENWREMHDMAVSEGEDDLVNESREKVRVLRKEAQRLKTEALLQGGGESSSSSCYLEIRAGAGGTESCDWASMLLKMYTRWAERRGFDVQAVHSSPGEEAGLRSTTVFIEGTSAYGWLRREAGVHRLVRVSPYDPCGRRHTSFSQVRLYPEADGGNGMGGKSAAAIPAKELRVETMRSQGAGGQHVNTTDSAVRITHIPTGLVALSQSDRSQHRNRESAMRVLEAKLFQLAEEERAMRRNKHTTGLGDNAWGSQIRSYVLTPYQMVKDHRTGFQEGNVTAVLDGELDSFIEATLEMDLKQ